MNNTIIDFGTRIPIAEVPESLAKARIPVHKWRQTDNGALEDFLEMLRTEAVDLYRHNGHLILVILVAVPYIDHVGSVLHELYEAYQECLDSSRPGRVTFKSRPFSGSLGETLLRYPDGCIENPQRATRRGIHEELGWVDSQYELSRWSGDEWVRQGPQPSDKYPGLQDAYFRHRMHCFIKDEIFDLEGYVHIDPKKMRKQVFHWMEI